MKPLRGVSFTWDERVNAVYIELRPVEDGGVTGNFVFEDDDLPGSVVLDFDPEGRVVGIEILGADALIGRDLLEKWAASSG